MNKEQNGAVPGLKRKKTALGRGLGALIPNIESIEASSNKENSNDFFQCDIELIQSNPYQPRVRFSENELNELSDSICNQGIIQPVVVRRADTGYELIAGERRFRAAKMAGLTEVPVIVKDVKNDALLEISLVENIQREDLNPMEEAEAYYHLATKLNITQDQLAERVGKSRSAIANFLRLRHLPTQIKDDIREGNLSMGHARALLGLETSAEQISAWQIVVSKELSVRETESLIKRMKAENKESKKPEMSSDDIYFTELGNNLSRDLGTKVSIKRRGKKGKVEIEFYSNDDLERLLGLFKQK